MDHLIEGYRRFRATTWPEERARYNALALEGQRPKTLVVACSDSRVDPQTVFGARPGELFVVRNVAGLVPPCEVDGHYHGTSAALEFGVRVLKVAHIVVLGHAQCGGVQAMVEGAPEEARDFVEPWITIARPVLSALPRNLSLDDRLARAEVEAIRLSLANLMTFPWIERAVSEGRLQLHGLRFAIRTGELHRVEGGRLVPVA
jgi:carbonic anhydrase